MSGVPVTIGPPTAFGRLRRRDFNSIKIMTLEGGRSSACPHGVNIDGLLILDFGEDRTLQMVELLGGMRGCKGKEDTARPSGVAGDIRLDPSWSGSVHVDWQVRRSKDVQREVGRVDFDRADYNRAVELSHDVFALLYDDHLTGFWFSMAR